MTYQNFIAPPICLHAPVAIADMILRCRMSLLKERYPDIKLRLNPKTPVPEGVEIYLGFENSKSETVRCRKLGEISSKTYIHRPSKVIRVLPDMIAGLDPDYVVKDRNQVANVEELYIAFDVSLQHVPGIRQTLDWVDSCVSCLFWLNDEALV